MASDPQLELRVSRLENDAASVYDLITDIRSTQHEHTHRLNAIDARLSGHDQRFDGIDQRFDGIEATLAEVVRRLPAPS